ncbi:MAG: hypothetical protein ABW137_04880 [Mycobacterium sp.]
MANEHTIGRKLVEWLRRYLPCEIAGTVCELGGAAIAYGATGSYAAAAVVATIGASVGYYAAAYVAAVRIAYGAQPSLPRTRRALTANALALRSVAIEFGPAEVIDSLLIRPVAYYLGPMMFGAVGGWIFAKVVADVGFYVLAILSYERFTGLLVTRTRSEEEPHESAATVATA